MGRKRKQIGKIERNKREKNTLVRENKKNYEGKK